MPPSAVSRIAAGSQPVALTTTTVRSAGPAPGRADRLERGQRVAQVGRDADVARDRARRRASTASASTSTATSVPSGVASRAAARASLPAWPAPRTQTVPPPGASGAHLRGGGADVEDLERLSSSGRSSGSRRPGRRGRRRRRCPRPRPAASPDRRRSTASSRSGVSVSDASVDDPRRPARAGSAKRSPTAATVPVRMPPESVSGLCILPRAATISAIRAAIASGSPSARSRIWRCEVESRQSRSTVDLELVRRAPAPRRRAARPAAAARRPASSDPVGAEPTARSPPSQSPS